MTNGQGVWQIISQMTDKAVKANNLNAKQQSKTYLWNTKKTVNIYLLTRNKQNQKQGLSFKKLF